MVRNYIKKTAKGSWSSHNMINAVNSCINMKMSCNASAKKFEIPEATLRRYIKKKLKVKIICKFFITGEH